MREIKLCSPKLQEFWAKLQPAFKLRYPGWGIYLSQTLRPVPEQFALFRKGRIVRSHFEKTKLIIDSAHVVQPREVVTNVDGITRLGAHNFNPALAFDVSITTPQGQNVWNFDMPQWKELGSFLVDGIEWGGNWKTFLDMPHFEDTDYRTKFNSGKLS